MSFEQFCHRLEERLKLPLPGEEAHNRFLATPVDRVPRVVHRRPPRPGGVMVLFYEDMGVLRFPLIRRPDYPGVHGGQISLPGGKADPGENAVDAAVRECEEEVGVPSERIRVLGVLSDYLVAPSNVLVTPVIASVPDKPAFRPDPFEVAGILEISVADVLDANAIRETEILVMGKYRMIAPHFDLENEIVWGATAMMLNELKLVLEDVCV